MSDLELLITGTIIRIITDPERHILEVIQTIIRLLDLTKNTIDILDLANIKKYFFTIDTFYIFAYTYKTMKNMNNILGLTSRPLTNGNGYAVQPRNLCSDFEGL